MCSEIVAQLDEKQQDVLAMLADEVVDGSDAFQQLANDMTSPTQFTDAQDRYLQQLSYLADTAEMLGLTGLLGVTEQIATNISLLEQSEQLSPPLLAALQHWPDWTQRYLADPLNDEVCLTLLAQLEGDHWPHPLEGADAKTLLQRLATIDLVTLEEDGGGEQPITDITDDDITLTPSDEVNQEVLDSFLQDAPNQAETLFEHLSLLRLGEDLASHIQTAQRASHTLKGAANLLNIKAVANISHELERILETMAEAGATPSSEDIQLLVNAADCIGTMIDALLGMDQPPGNIKAVLLGLSQWRYQQHAPESQPVKEPLPAPEQASEQSPDSSRDNPLAAPDASSDLAAIYDLAEPPSAQASPPDKSPKPPEPRANTEALAVEEMLGLAENMNINMVQSKELYKRISNSLALMKHQELTIQERRFALENLVDGRSMAGPQIGLNNEREIDLDPLEMDRYDEIHLSTHQFIEAVSDTREITLKLQDQLLMFDGLIQQQQRYTDAVQHLLLKSKQIPVSQYGSRLQRCVRQASQMANKQVRLEIVGDTVAVDKDMMNQLVDALMHLLRNAVDHGIEQATQRTAANKPEQGCITLRFDIDGQQLLIRSSDDGQGLNYEAIYQTALAKGLLASTSERPSDDTLSNLLLTPGFTTRATATQLSGRGIGLDAVRASVEQWGGHISISSTPGQGTTFTLTLPMKQVTQHLIIVKESNQRYAVSSTDIKQILPSAGSNVTDMAGQTFIEFDNKLFKYQPLKHLIGTSSPSSAAIKEGSVGTVLLIEVNNRLLAIEVEQLLNSYDLVVKKTGRHMQHLPGIDGICILGDGALVPVLNLRILAGDQPGLAAKLSSASHSAQPHDETTPEPTAIPHVLVVDDSLSVRSSLKQLLSDVGYQVETANDGMDAVEKIATATPTVVLVDMEMPRMNGLELTQYIRRQEQLKHIPVIMLTSRSQQKHRDLAEKSGVTLYKTKPYSDFDLLQALQEVTTP